MKPALLLILLVSFIACERSVSPFTIDPSKLYTPNELVSQANGGCTVTQAWEGKTVRVTGSIDNLNVFDHKFWLRGEGGKGFVEIYFADPSTQSGKELYTYAKANKGLKITVTGLTVGNDKPTQLTCTKGVSIKINDKTAISL